MSAQQPVGIFKVVAALVGHLVARVGEKTVSREREDGGYSYRSNWVAPWWALATLSSCAFSLWVLLTQTAE
jgi:hypothetical protein